MLSTLIQKELKAIILSPKFVATLAVCSVLILLAVYTGIKDYEASVAQWETSTHLADRQVAEATNWRHLSYQALRKPDPMQIFVSGLNNDIGRWSDISTESAVKLRHSHYSDDPIFAVFRHVDFTFIVQVVLSLFAILFTFDAVSGERESGTLRLVFANSVPRAKYLLGKAIGTWLGLVAPISVPIILALLVVRLSGASLDGTHWARIVFLIGVSLLFFSFFIVLGILISTVTKRSNVAFLVSLVVWVAFVLIIPRAGVMAAGQMVHVPRVAEIEGQRDGYAKDLWAQHYKEMEDRFMADREESGSCSEDEEAMWARMKREDSLRRIVEQKIEVYEVKLMEHLRRRKTVQERLAFTLARISPVSAFQLAAMSLAGTDVALKSRYEDAMSAYRKQFTDYVEKKSAEAGDMGGFVQVKMSSEEGFSITTGRDVALDVAEMPRFTPATVPLRAAIAPVITDLGILGIGILLAFLGSFLAFLRCDVR
jgi:ABC-type transport system involved in multi-copper enzyme maturation permease subunit